MLSGYGANGCFQRMVPSSSSTFDSSEGVATDAYDAGFHLQEKGEREKTFSRASDEVAESTQAHMALQAANAAAFA